MTNLRSGPISAGNTRRGTLVAGEWLALAATPAFGAMALWTGVIDMGPVAAFCSAAHASPIGSMGAMYLLMSVIHVTPWLRLLSERDDRGRSQA